MNIIIILGGYYPYYSAVGKCAGNIADELSKENQITVICKKRFTKEKNVEIINNQKIIRVDTEDNKIRNKLNEKIANKKGIKNKIYKVLLKIHKMKEMAKIIFCSVTIRKELVNEYVKALYKINESIDFIIPLCMPFESIVAATKYTDNEKNIKTKIIPYLFDQFTRSDTLHRNNLNKFLKRKKNLNLERRVFLKSYKILAMNSLKEHFLSDLREITNIYYIEHPLLLKYEDIKKKKNDVIIISYVGGLYKNYVEPNYFLKLYQLSNIKNSTLHFYIIGNCGDTVNKYAHVSLGKIINHGSVDKQTASRVTSQSDVLISIAEKKGIQMSSKIFEYISNGKPIIHFYSVDNDVNLKILNKYPLSLCLKQDYNKLDENINKFNQFCNKYSKANVPFEEVEKIYYNATPKYTANLIKELIIMDDNT